MICLGIAGLHFKNDDNTALWVIGLILLIVCVFFFIKTLRQIIRFHNAPKLDELMNGDKNRKIK
jgi:hypothetical protein